MDKLTCDFQNKYLAQQYFDPTVKGRIDSAVKVHGEADGNPLSSAASCLNVIGSLAINPKGLKTFLNSCGLAIDAILEFPTGASIGGRVYNDSGCAIFEWVGPRRSPINEAGGGRGQHRTSVDAFVLAKIDGKTTQILIEWKFTEGLSRPLTLGRFCGGQGVERLHRYSTVLAKLRREYRKLKKSQDFPFLFSEEGYKESQPETALGLYDLSPDHLYQLMRMTLLARTTTGMKLGEHVLEDYRVVHLTHSQNDMINILKPEYLLLSPGLKRAEGKPLHEVWSQILAPSERHRFVHGYWDKAIPSIEDSRLRSYLAERYG